MHTHIHLFEYTLVALSVGASRTWQVLRCAWCGKTSVFITVAGILLQ